MSMSPEFWVLFIFVNVVTVLTRTPLQGLMFFLTIVFVVKDGTNDIFGALSAYMFSIVMLYIINAVTRSTKSTIRTN